MTFCGDPQGIRWIAVMIPLAAIAVGHAEVLRTQAGGVMLGFEEETGRIVELAVGGASVWLERAAPASGFAMWDHATEEGWQPLTCYVEEFDGDLRFSGTGHGQ